ncbi:MAG: ABC transporter ATP-binding protein [Chloroflexi bacterium]|nr:ABC transporter ATP-binding protein [Chloroflexota bacterium]
MTFSWDLWRFTEGVRWRIALAVSVGLFAVAAGVARLALLGWIGARIFQGDSFSDLVPLIIATAASIAARSLFLYAKEEIANGTALQVQFSLRQRLFDQVTRLGPSHFDRQRTGDVTVGVIEGVEQLETFFGQYLPQLIVAALAPVGIFIFMGWLDLPVAAIYFGFALVTLVLPQLLKQKNAEASIRRRDAYGSFAADFLDSVQGLATLKAFGQSGRRGSELAERAQDVFRSTMGVLFHNAIAQGLTILAITVGAAVALYVGALRVESGAMELAELLVVLMLGVEVFRPLRELSQLFHQGLLGVAAAESVLDVDRATPLTPDAEVQPVEQLEPRIEFDNVTFSYPTGRRPALSDVSFTVEPGRRVGVVGRSGSGKSTLLWLLQRLYTPQEGTIRLGGRDLNELRFADIRAQMAVVLQDTYLFHGSVLANLRFARPDATEDEIREAAQAANAHEFINSLPEGYATVIGERGHRLSGGERQRIAIARALLRDAPMLILDEALSSVDAENEATIQAALDRLMQGRTTLIMAHRLSSVRDCDEILVLDEGRLVERGDHETLLAEGGVYDWLMAGQMTDPSIDRFVDDAPLAERTGAAATSSLAIRDYGGGATEAIVRAEGMGWKETSARLLALAAPYWFKTTLSFLTGVAHFFGAIAVGVIGALMVANVRDGDSITLLAVLLIVVAVLTGLFRFLENWVSHDMAFRLLADMRIALFRKLDQLAPAYLLRRRSGDLVSMATQDVETVEYFFAHTIANAFVSVVIPGVALVTLFIVDWRLGLGLAPLLIIAALSPLFTRRIVDRLGSRSRDHLGALNAHMVDTLQGLREVTAFQRERERKTEFEGLMRDYMPIRGGFNRQISAQRTLLEGLTGYGGLAVLTIGGALAVRGDIDSSLAPLLTLLAMGAFMPVAELAQVGRRLGDTLGATRRLTAVHSEAVAVVDGPGTGAEVQPTDGVGVSEGAFASVGFSYEDTPRAALEEVSFDLRPGGTVALVGPSGAGKTTAAHLMLRFWDPQDGKITLEDADLRTYRLDDLRGQVALVAQDTYLFNASIRNNLLVAKPEATEGELLLAIERAGLADFVESLPDGLDTPVGERGAQLSGGQRQRVAIGRALLKDAPVLILDEATSHLDGLNERLVRNALDELMSDRTTLVIAHRLSTVRDADQIVVLDEGKVVEIGQHDQLASEDGLYSRLVRRQLSAAKR